MLSDTFSAIHLNFAKHVGHISHLTVLFFYTSFEGFKLVGLVNSTKKKKVLMSALISN